MRRRIPKDDAEKPASRPVDAATTPHAAIVVKTSVPSPTGCKNAGVTVREVTRTGARPVFDVTAEDAANRGKEAPDAYTSAIVRLLPPEDMSPADVEQWADSIRAQGAVAVKVVRRGGAGNAAAEAAARDQAVEAPKSMRQVLDELLSSAKTSTPILLRELVDEAVAEGEREAPPALIPSCSVPVWPVGLTLRNFYRFRGEHHIKLEPTAYALVARDQQNSERSNWLGKTTTVTAIGFALLGLHTQPREDDWITNGESEGEVELELSDGSVVRRSRRRGQSTQVVFERKGQPSANQAAANQAIQNFLGLTEQDFGVVAHIRQKEIDRMVRARPAERLELFSGWMPELGILRGAESYVRQKLTLQCNEELRARVEVERLQTEATDRKADADRFSEGAFGEDLGTRLEQELRRQALASKTASERLRTELGALQAWQRDALSANMYDQKSKAVEALRFRVDRQSLLDAQLATESRQSELTEAVVRVRELKSEELLRAAWRRDSEGAKKFDELTAKAAQAKQRLESFDRSKLSAEQQQTSEALRDAEQERRKCRANVELKKKLVAGEFDGRCPVAELQCPATDQINGRRQKNRQELKLAEQQLNEAGVVVARCETAAHSVSSHLEAMQAAQQEAQNLRLDLDRYRSAKERIAKDGEPPTDQSVQQKVAEANAVLNACEEALKKAKAEHQALQKEAQALRDGEQELIRLQPSKDRIKKDGLPPEGSELERLANAAFQDALKADRVIEQVLRYRRDLQQIAEELKQAEQHAKEQAVRGLLYRDALAIVGRMGAQRAIAEREIRQVERGANDILSECGIDLQVTLRWGKENTTELATTCERCGSTCSGKAKKCAKCGAERGPKIDPKVELELSSKSGAADDLAGLALSVSAGAWLRDRRGSAWRALIVDEAFASLDAANRRALATYLATAAQRGGYRQLIVIAHDSASLSTMPARISIVGQQDGSSRFEV